MRRLTQQTFRAAMMRLGNHRHWAAEQISKRNWYGKWPWHHTIILICLRYWDELATRIFTYMYIYIYTYIHVYVHYLKLIVQYLDQGGWSLKWKGSFALMSKIHFTYLGMGGNEDGESWSPRPSFRSFDCKRRSIPFFAVALSWSFIVA